MGDINGENDTLIVKQWGYQTICPDEENTTGYYKVKNNDYYNRTVYGWRRPSLTSEKKEISYVVCKDAIWGWGEKYNRRDGLTWVKVCEKPVFWMPKDKIY